MAFGPFVFDPATRQLQRGSVPVHLPPRALAVLAELLEHPGELITKDELLEAAWTGTPVTDEALMQAISLVRQALGDDPRAPEFIQTVPRVGYRFIGAVDEASALPADGYVSTDRSGVPRPAPERSRSVARVGWIVLAVLVLATAAWMMRETELPPAQIIRFVVEPPDGVALATWPMREGLTISQDGRYLAFLGDRGDRRSIFVRDLEQFDARPIELATASSALRGAASLQFSPDNSSIAFYQGRGLWTVPRTGGAPTVLRELSHPQGAIWLGDEGLIHRWNQRLVHSPDPDNAAEVLGTGNFLWPDLLPGGRYVVASWFRWGTESADDGTIWIFDRATGQQRELPFRGTAPRYATSGHLLFTRQGGLYAVPFDAERAEPTGTPVRVLDGLATEASDSAPAYALSAEGTLVYRPATAPASYHLIRIDPDGQATELLEETKPIYSVRASPNGRHLAVTTGLLSGNLWLYDLDRDTFRRLLPPGNDYHPVWHPDGERLFHIAWLEDGRKQLRVLSANEPASARTLLEYPTSFPLSRLASLWTIDPAGERLLYSPILRGTTEYDIWAFAVDGNGEPGPVLGSVNDEWFADLSPDGRWLAYVSDEAGRDDVYLTGFPGAARRWLLSSDGGLAPRWAPTGDRIYYQQGSRIFEVPITFSPDPLPGPATMLVDTGLEPALGSRPFDVHPDGSSLLVVGSRRPAPVQQLNVIVGWFDELRRLVPTEK